MFVQATTPKLVTQFGFIVIKESKIIDVVASEEGPGKLPFWVRHHLGERTLITGVRIVFGGRWLLFRLFNLLWRGDFLGLLERGSDLERFPLAGLLGFRPESSDPLVRKLCRGHAKAFARCGAPVLGGVCRAVEFAVGSNG